MSKVFVQVYGERPAGSKPDGIPDGWPATTKPAPDDATEAEAGWLLFTDEEYDTYREAQSSAYDAWRSGHDLPEHKAASRARIDARTVQLIDEGFAYAGKVFSLSSAAQRYWEGLGLLVANGLLTEPDDFPMVVNTLDDLDTYAITDIADAVGVFATAAATVKARLASGTALKDQVRAATTTAEVDAVGDDR